MKNNFRFFTHYFDCYYFDSAATTLKPNLVIDAIKEGYEKYTLPVGKSIYVEAEIAFMETEEKARKIIFGLIRGENLYKILFSYSVTAIFEKLLFLFLLKLKKIKKKFTILVPYTVHISCINPINRFIENNDCEIEFFFYKNTIFDYLLVHIDLAIFPAVDHVTGYFLNKEEVAIFKNKNKNTIIIIDASQLFSLQYWNLETYGVDVLIWSSHKMYGPDGIAVLAVTQKVENILKESNFTQSFYLLKNYFMGGSFSYASLFAFIKAFEWNEKNIYADKNYLFIQQSYIFKVYQSLVELKNINLISSKENNYSIITFFHNEIHANDIALLFSKHKIAVRSGELCTYNNINNKGLVRISFGVYNDQNDIDYLVEKIKTIFN